MKTKTTFGFLLGLAVLSFVLLNCSRSNSDSTKDRFPHYADHGVQISIFKMPTNCYPIAFFAGTNMTSEFDYYVQRFNMHSTISEVLPAEQDPGGNWGTPANDFQLSLRFRHARYPEDRSIPVVVILRNLSPTNSPRWWRNALPDHGYQITIQSGTKIFHRMRPQNALPKIVDWSDGSRNTDPYECQIMPHVEELTVIDLKQFLDPKQLGQYSAQVQLSVPRPDGKGETKLISGTATFEIVER